MTTGGAAFLLAWIAFVSVKIAVTPEPGAESPQQLAEEFQKAVIDSDIEHARLLIKDEPEEDSVHATLSAALCSATPTVVARQRNNHWYIIIRDTESGIECGNLPAAFHDDRWFIDLWADPLRSVRS